MLKYCFDKTNGQLDILNDYFNIFNNPFGKVDLYFDRMDHHIEYSKKKIWAKNNQRQAGLQLHAEQPRLAEKSGVTTGKNIRVRKKGATPAKRFGDISSAQIDDNPMSRTRFEGKESADHSAPVKITTVTLLADQRVEARKPHLLPVEMHILTLTGGLLHAGSTSTTLVSICLHSLNSGILIILFHKRDTNRSSLGLCHALYPFSEICYA